MALIIACRVSLFLGLTAQATTCCRYAAAEPQMPRQWVDNWSCRERPVCGMMVTRVLAVYYWSGRMKRTILFCLVLITLAVACPAAEQPELETVVINGTTYTLVPASVMRAWGFDVPEIPREKNAAYVYFEAMRVHAGLETGTELGKLRDKVLQDGWTGDSEPLEQYLEDNAKALELVERAAGMPACYFPPCSIASSTLEDIVEAPPAVSLCLLEPVPQMRELGFLLVVRGRKLEFDSRPADALGVYLLVPRLGNHASRGPSLSAGLVGLAVDTMGMQAIEEGIARHALDDATLAQVQTQLSETSAQRPDLAWAMRNERASSEQLIEHILRHPVRYFVRVRASGFWDRQEELLLAFVRFRAYLRTLNLTADEWRAMLRRDLRDYWGIVEEHLRMPLVECLKSDLDEQLEDLTRNWRGTQPCELADLLGPAGRGVRLVYGRADLHWTVLDVEFALARYRAKHGRYPEALDELRPLMLTGGIDPFADKPLNYRLEDDGSFTIWSVGRNLVDDGGKLDDVGNFCDTNDYVWNSRLLAADPADLDR